MPRTSRRQRRAIAAAANVTPIDGRAAAMAAHPSNQDHGARRGLTMRAKAYLARRYLDKLGPAIVPPLVAGAVVLVTLGVVVGLVLGLALALRTGDEL